MITKDLFKEKLIQNNKYDILNEYACCINEKSYLKIDDKYNIFFKEYNPLTIIFAFENDEERLYEMFLKYIDKKNKVKIKSINRKSNIEIEKLKNNLFKTLLNGNFEYAVSFAKELYFRDKFIFFKILYSFAFVGELKNFKFLFVYALEKILDNKYYENIFFATIFYLVKFRDNIYSYGGGNINKKELPEFNKKLFNLVEYIADKYEIKNEKFILKISHELSDDFEINKDLKNLLEKYL